VNAPDVTEDRLIGGRVALRQPADGYRAAIDPVFLAAIWCWMWAPAWARRRSASPGASRTA
jgi:hypothetical protein